MLPERQLPLLGTIYGGHFPRRGVGRGAWGGAKYAARQSQPNAALTKQPSGVNREIDGSAPCATGLTDRGPASQVGSISISPRDKVQTQGSTWTSAASGRLPESSRRITLTTWHCGSCRSGPSVALAADTTRAPVRVCLRECVTRERLPHRRLHTR